MLETIKKYEKRISDLQFILSVFVLNFVIDMAKAPIFLVLEKYLGETEGPLDTDISTIIFLCIIAPVIESYLIAGLVWLFHKKIKLKKITAFFITGVIFALLHSYSIVYIISALPGSLLIIYSYMYYESKKLSSFQVMLIIHILINFFYSTLQFII